MKWKKQKHFVQDHVMKLSLYTDMLIFHTCEKIPFINVACHFKTSSCHWNRGFVRHAYKENGWLPVTLPLGKADTGLQKCNNQWHWQHPRAALLSSCLPRILKVSCDMIRLTIMHPPDEWVSRICLNTTPLNCIATNALEFPQHQKWYLMAEWNCKCRKLYLVCLSFCLLSDLSQNAKISASLAKFPRGACRCVQTAEWMSPPLHFASGTFVEVSWNKQFVSLTFSDLNCDSAHDTL